jgi:phosphoglycolate phosphatase-like HAD superfamily hydrolase
VDLSTIKVCLFDVNGVLIDSNAANAKAMAAAFTDDPVLGKRIAAHYLTLTGVDRGSKIRIIQQEVMGAPFRQKEFDLRWESFKTLAHKSMQRAPLVAGCREVLAELGKRGLTRVALSNTPLDELEEILAAHDLQVSLDIIRGGGDWPKSESLVRLLDEFHFERDQSIFCGDGRKDLAAARSAGLSFVAIDPGAGEFNGETGFHGPYQDLAEWGEKVWGLKDYR